METVPNPSGLCLCNCGGTTKLAPYTSRRDGYIKGQPVRFIYGHNRRGTGRGCAPRADSDAPPGSVIIPLTRGKAALVDAADAALVAPYTWHARRSGRCWYAYASSPHADGRTYIALHRLILGVGARNGPVDHRNHDGLDCRRANLRVATNSQNKANTPRYATNTSGYKGVHRTRYGGWEAWIGYGGKPRYIGVFAAAEDAARAYDAAARERYGEFAWCNFPAD